MSRFKIMVTKSGHTKISKNFEWVLSYIKINLNLMQISKILISIQNIHTKKNIPMKNQFYAVLHIKTSLKKQHFFLGA